MVKHIKSWKIDFYKNTDESGGAQNEAISQCPPNCLIIHSDTQKHGRMWGYCSPKQLLQVLDTNRGIYEVLNKYPQKIYFDIDHKDAPIENYLSIVKTQILQFFPDACMAISGSITTEKTSFHIVLQNYLIHNDIERDTVKFIVKYICENINNAFDWKVYTKNRNMKCVGQSKRDGRIQEIIEDPDIRNHIITAFHTDYPLPLPELPEQVSIAVEVAKAHATFDITSLPKLNLPVPTTLDYSKLTPLHILQLLPLTSECDHSYKHIVARYCFYNDISFEHFCAWLNFPSVIPKWEAHWRNLEKFPPVSPLKIKQLLKYFYPSIIFPTHFRIFADTFKLPEHSTIYIPTLTQNEFRHPAKWKLYDIPMGNGKTAQTIDYLQTRTSFVWIAPNRALASNTHTRMLDNGVNAQHYESFTTKQKQAGALTKHNQMIICTNSLHYLQNATYDTVVIDEPETFINRWDGEFMDKPLGTKKKNWEVFLHIVRNAKSIILLDAFTTTKMLNIMKLIDGENASHIIFKKHISPSTRTINYIEEYALMLRNIINDLRAGKKLFIFYPYKNGYKTKSMTRQSMDELLHTLQQETGKRGIAYHAGQDEDIKAGLADVNVAWAQVDFVITNTVITCGVNYDNNDMDAAYIFIAGMNKPRDILQVSYRARFLSSGLIHMCFMDKYIPERARKNDKEMMACPIYSQLYDDIGIELNAPLQETVHLFCSLANFNQQTDPEKISKELNKEHKDLLEKYQIGALWKGLENICHEEADHIQNLMFSKLATMEQKFKLQKYFFINKFTEQADPELMEQAWDSQYLFFFEKLKQSQSDPEQCIFRQIAAHNKWTDLFPTNEQISKLKIPKQVLIQIFKKFTFKYLSISSSPLKVYQSIVNSYFQKNIISSTYDKSKHTTFKIKEEFFGWDAFVKDFGKHEEKSLITWEEPTIIEEEES